MVEDTAPLGASQGAARRVPMGLMLRNQQESSNHSEAGVRIAVGNWHQVERDVKSYCSMCPARAAQ